MRDRAEGTAAEVREAAKYFEMALKAHIDGRLEEAEEGYRAVMGLDPLHVSARNNLALILLGRGEAEEAVRFLEEALEIMPEFADGWNNLASAWVALGKIDSARAALRRAVELGHRDALSNLARLEANAGNAAEALAVAERAFQASPSAQIAEIAFKAAFVLKDEQRIARWSHVWFSLAPENPEAFAAVLQVLRNNPVELEKAARAHLQHRPENALA